MVEQLLGCLLDCEPGLSCGLVKHYISPSTTCPSHYVGVILGEPSSAPYPPYAGDISRFVWNFLADKTSIPSKNISSSCPKDCSGDDELCIREEADGKGVCVISTTRYSIFSQPLLDNTVAVIEPIKQYLAWKYKRYFSLKKL